MEVRARVLIFFRHQSHPSSPCSELVQGHTIESDKLRQRERTENTVYLTTRTKVRDMVRDVKWLNSRYCVAAVGNSVAFVDFRESLLVPMSVGKFGFVLCSSNSLYLTHFSACRLPPFRTHYINSRDALARH
jgi:hypothetical protein